MGKSGHNTKDANIIHGFNENKAGGMTSKELKAIEHQARVDKIRLDRELKKRAEEAAKLLAQNAEKKEEKPPADPDPDPPSEEKETKLANQMLNDLRYAYRNAMGSDGKKGRARLLELMKNDGEFKFAMKELIKVEVGLVTSKLRGKETGGGPANQMVFVVLKGLKEDEGILSQMEPDDSAIDVKQITNAVNPDGTVYSPDDVDKW